MCIQSRDVDMWLSNYPQSLCGKRLGNPRGHHLVSWKIVKFNNTNLIIDLTAGSDGDGASSWVTRVYDTPNLCALGFLML